MSFGHCSLHLETPGIALCRRCGDSACQRCALSREESLCLACETRIFETSLKRIRFRLKLCAGLITVSLPLLVSGLLEWFCLFYWTESPLVRGGPAFAGFLLGLLLAAVVHYRRTLALSRIEVWAGENRRTLETFHELFRSSFEDASDAEATVANMLISLLEESRNQALESLAENAPGIRRGASDQRSSWITGGLLFGLAAFGVGLFLLSWGWTLAFWIFAGSMLGFGFARVTLAFRRLKASSN